MIGRRTPAAKPVAERAVPSSRQPAWPNLRRGRERIFVIWSFFSSEAYAFCNILLIINHSNDSCFSRTSPFCFFDISPGSAPTGQRVSHVGLLWLGIHQFFGHRRDQHSLHTTSLTARLHTFRSKSIIHRTHLHFPYNAPCAHSTYIVPSYLDSSRPFRVLLYNLSDLISSHVDSLKTLALFHFSSSTSQPCAAFSLFEPPADCMD